MFALIFSTVAIMLLYMMLGLLLCKTNKAVVSHAKSFSGLLIYILGPAMIINSFLNLEYTSENIISIGKYFIVSLLLQVVFFGILYIILSKRFDDPKYRIMSVGAVLGNVGFIGMPLIASVIPGEPIVLCYSSINVMSMNLIVFTIGVFMITNDKKYMSIRNAIMNPTTIAIIISLPLFILKVQFPDVIRGSIELLAKMVTPMCMLILGMRLSEARIKDIFTRPFVYATCMLKLVVFPLVAFLFVKWLPFVDNNLKITVIVLAMTPAGVIIESLAELHECKQELAANVVLLTTILSVVTIPLMTTILI